MKLKIQQIKRIVRITYLFGLLSLIMILSGCLGIERVTYKELEISKWKFDHGEYSEALPTIQKFANHDNPDAQYMLGYMYFYGKGVKIDRKKANYYFNESGKRGYSPALMAKHVIAEKQSNSNMSIMSPAVVPEQSPISTEQNTRVAEIKVTQMKKVLKNKPMENKAISLDSNKILLINNQLFTIQVLALDNLDEIKAIIDKYQLYNEYYLYQTTRNDKPWYVLISGRYKKVSNARKRIEQLPAVMKKWHPFVNNVTEVHRQIKIV